MVIPKSLASPSCLRTRGLSSIEIMEAPGFLLCLPPTPVKARFVMLEESSKIFYDVDCMFPLLKNPSSWATTGISSALLGAERLAIVVPDRLNAEWRTNLAKQGPLPDGRPYNPDFEVARLVGIAAQEQQAGGKVIRGKVLGKVNVRPYSTDVMSFATLESMKPSVLVDEVKNGLLGKLYGGSAPEKPSTNPQALESTSGKWRVDAAALNYELDGFFAAGVEIKQGSAKWLLS
jgi:hypothetical protein